MREIEFRGKDLRYNKWVYGFYSQFHNRPVVDEPNSHQIFQVLEDENVIRIAGTSIGGVWYIVDENTLGQYTGLKDKNGTKIYEGDVLEFEFDDIGKQKAVVYFNDKYAMFGLKPLGNFVYATIDEGVVIGNIYDNPQLLNKNDM